MGLTLDWNNKYGRTRTYGVSSRGALLSASSRRKAGFAERYRADKTSRAPHAGRKNKSQARTVSNSYRQPARPAFLPQAAAAVLAGVGACALAAKRAVIVSLLLGLFLTLSYGLYAGHRALSSSTYFALNRVVIEGTQRLENEEILGQAGIKIGQNVVGMNLTELETRLRQNPWIRSVRVKRLLPDGLSIYIEERPAMYWLVRGETIYYADDHAEPIAPVGNERFASLPTVEMEQGCDECVTQLKAFLEALGGNSLFLSRKEAGGFRVFREEGITVYHEANNIALISDLKDWRRGMEKVRQVWADLARRGDLNKVKSIQAAGDKTFVRMNQPVRREAVAVETNAVNRAKVGLD